MSYRDRFRSWCNEDTVQAHPYITFYKPETMYSLDDIQRRDRYAAADIDTLQTMIADFENCITVRRCTILPARGY